MANNPITTPLPADLPTNWTYGQTIGASGTDVGLTPQHGYNYLMQQVNAAQQAATQIGQAFSGLPSLGSDGKIPAAQLPAMNYDPAGSAATVQDNLTNHINNKSNPHNVTAQQVGADPAGTAAAVQQALTSQIAALTAKLGEKAEIYTFSYVGTGTYNEPDSPNSVTADKPILLCGILFYKESSGKWHDTANGSSSDDDPIQFMLSSTLSETYTAGVGFGDVSTGGSQAILYGKKSSDGKTFYWYGSGGSNNQFNTAGTTYYGFYIC